MIVKTNVQQFLTNSSWLPVEMHRHWQLALIVLLTCFPPHVRGADEAYFPIPVFFPKDKELNGIIDEHLSLQLKALEEPSLWKKSQTDRKVEVYRFLWLATGENPISIRI